MSGGTGADTLNGGDGNDTFRFDAVVNGLNKDTITGFDLKGSVEAPLGDRIEFLRTRFQGFSVDDIGMLKDTAFLAAAGANAATDVNHRIIYNLTTGQIWYDRDGLDGAAPNLIATISGTVKPVLTNDYFVIV